MSTKYEFYNPLTNQTSITYGLRQRGNSFTIQAGESHTLESIVIKLTAPHGSPGTCTVNVHSVDGSGKPIGGSLSSGTFDGNTSVGIVTIPMSAVILNAGAKYCFLVRAALGSANNYINLDFRASTGTYPDGSWITTNDGVAWTVDTTSDVYFEEWGDTLVGSELAGRFSVVGTQLYYIDASDDERYLLGIPVTYNLGKELIGRLGIRETELHYIDAYGTERYFVGTMLVYADDGELVGRLGIKDTELHYIDKYENERYLLGELVV